jgi:hypothetical protein
MRFRLSERVTEEFLKSLKSTEHVWSTSYDACGIIGLTGKLHIAHGKTGNSSMS